MPEHLFRGNHYGIFGGPNGYYIAEIQDDGSHSQPDDGGTGWDPVTLFRLEIEANDLEFAAQAEINRHPQHGERPPHEDN